MKRPAPVEHTDPTTSVRLLLNPHRLPRARWSAAQDRILPEAGGAAARAEIGGWPDYAPTPLAALPGLAAAHGLGALYWKDEGARFRLRSFKALGGAYAVFRVLAQRVAAATGAAADSVASADLAAGRWKDLVKDAVVTTATDGNHGRSVAWGAQMFGCRCVVYMHMGVSAGRQRAVEAFGAEVVRTPGTYDDSVRVAAADAAKFGRFVISDTSYEGYEDVPRDVMQGYTVLAHEAIAQLPAVQGGAGTPPTHVFVQGGVGGLAAAVLARFWQAWGGARPTFVVVEPERADCLYRSALAGEPTVVPGDLDTIMAGLAAGEVSLLAFELLKDGADAFMIIPDSMAPQAMRTLAEPHGDDPPVVAGESAVAGLAGCLAAAADPAMARALGLDRASRVLFVGSEGDTDPEVYRQIVGATAEQVRAGRR